MEVEPRVAQQPAVDLGRLVGRDVVDDEMDVEVFGHAAIDRFKKRRNSTARWRSVMSAMTCPEATSRAA